MSEVTGSPGLREQSTGELVNRLTEQVTRLVRDELQLARVELKEKGRRVGFGAGLGGAAGVFALLGLGALVIAAIVGLAIVLPAWAAALVVGGALLLIAALLGLIGGKQMKRGSPPIPEQAVASVRQDVETVRGSVKP